MTAGRLASGRYRRTTIAVFLLLGFGWLLVAGTHSQCLATEAKSAGTAGPNFSVYGDREWVEVVFKRANALRAQIADQWLGYPIPDGFGPATINVKITEEDQSFTWLLEEGSHRTAHMIWVYTTPEQIESSLAHEVCHAVLWAHDPNFPAFAHEAIASTYDGDERKKLLRETLQWFAQKQRWPQLRELFTAKVIKPSNHSNYATSASVVQFLLSRTNGDKEKFLQFASTGARSNDWDDALRKYYGISGVAELQPMWQEWLTAAQ